MNVVTENYFLNTLRSFLDKKVKGKEITQDELNQRMKGIEFLYNNVNVDIDKLNEMIPVIINSWNNPPNKIQAQHFLNLVNEIYPENEIVDKFEIV